MEFPEDEKQRRRELGEKDQKRLIMARQPIGVIPAEEGRFIVVCSDGTTWKCVLASPYGGWKWEQLVEPIPGSPADTPTRQAQLSEQDWDDWLKR